MPRLRFYDLRVLPRFSQASGLCQNNVPELAAIANACQENLIYDKAASNESWHGTFAEIAFNVSRSQPYITLPREIARLEFPDVCNNPVPLNNQFAEYLRFGNGRMASDRCHCPGQLSVYSRNNAVTFTDLSNAPQRIRVYSTNAQDISRRVLIQGVDSNGVVVYSQDGLTRTSGVFLSLDSVPVTSVISWTFLTGIQKDQTAGQVQFYQVDPTTGDEVLLLTMEPGETTASYRRYYFSNLPCACCPVPGASEGTVQVTAIAKLDLIPVQVDTDWLLIQSREAFIEEATAIRLRAADTAAAQQMAELHHRRAIRLLISELGHFEGVTTPSVGYHPFGSERHETFVNMI